MRALLIVALAGFLAPAWATNTNKPMTLSQIAARQVEAKYGAADAIWRDTPVPETGEFVDLDVRVVGYVRQGADRASVSVQAIRPHVEPTYAPPLRSASTA